MAAKAAPLQEGMCRLAGSGSWRLDASQPSLFLFPTHPPVVSAYPLSILHLTVPAELFGGVSQSFILDSRRPSEDLVYQPISSGGSWIGPDGE